MANIYKQIGERLRRLRKREDLTQAQLAERAGITTDYLGRIERGRGAVTLATLVQIAEALNVQLRQIVDLDELSSAPREQVLKSIQTILRKKDTAELRRVCAILEVLEFR